MFGNTLVSYRNEEPEANKNNYNYVEFTVNTDNMEMEGSSASYELQTAKYSTMYLIVLSSRQTKNAIDICKTIRSCNAVL